MQTWLKVFVFIFLLALICETCEDPAIRIDISHVALWHRALMLIVGAGNIAIYGGAVRVAPRLLSRWLALYVCCFALLVAATKYLWQ
jgi:hypothetical protein